LNSLFHFSRGWTEMAGMANEHASLYVSMIKDILQIRPQRILDKQLRTGSAATMPMCSHMPLGQVVTSVFKSCCMLGPNAPQPMIAAQNITRSGRSRLVLQ
jgi:hypothetical protein